MAPFPFNDKPDECGSKEMPLLARKPAGPGLVYPYFDQ
jgi:hypothetical protein